MLHIVLDNISTKQTSAQRNLTFYLIHPHSSPTEARHPGEGRSKYNEENKTNRPCPVSYCYSGNSKGGLNYKGCYIWIEFVRSFKKLKGNCSNSWRWIGSWGNMLETLTKNREEKFRKLGLKSMVETQLFPYCIQLRIHTLSHNYSDCKMGLNCWPGSDVPSPASVNHW